MKKRNSFILILSLTFVYCVAQNFSTSLLDAAAAGNVEEVKKLIQKRVDVNKADDDGNTSLKLAAENGHLQVIQELLRAKSNVNKANNQGITPLMVAIVYTEIDEGLSLSMVKKLIQAGADVNKADYLGFTALTLAGIHGTSSLAKELLRAGANVSKADLPQAIISGNSEVIKELIKAGADVKKGTPVHDLIIHGDEYLPSINDLLQAGADINKKGRWGTTALMEASKEGHVEIVKGLLQAGADINKKNDQDKTAFDLAKTPEIRQLILEAQKKRAEITKIKPTIFKEIEAIGTAQQEIDNLNRNYQIALRQKRNVDAQKIQQQLIAQERNLKFKLDQFKKLMTQVTMNIADADGNTPLHKAVQANSLKLVEWIFQFQPDLAKRKNNAGQTPVDLAAGRPEILKLFVGLKR